MGGRREGEKGGREGGRGGRKRKGRVRTHCEEGGGGCDVVIEYAVEGAIHSVVDKVHEGGCGLGRSRGNPPLADDVDS